MANSNVYVMCNENNNVNINIQYGCVFNVIMSQ